jgi:hypothetical protein
MRRKHTQGVQVIGSGADQILRIVVFVVKRPGGECSSGTRDTVEAAKRAGAAREGRCATQTH